MLQEKTSAKNPASTDIDQVRSNFARKDQIITAQSSALGWIFWLNKFENSEISAAARIIKNKKNKIFIGILSISFYHVHDAQSGIFGFWSNNSLLKKFILGNPDFLDASDQKPFWHRAAKT